MNEPKRLIDDPEAPTALRELMVRAKPSRPMTPGEFGRGARRIATASTLAAGLLLWLKGPALAALLGVGVGAAFSLGVPLLFEADQPASAPTSAPVPSSTPALRHPSSVVPRTPKPQTVPTPAPPVPQRVRRAAPRPESSETVRDTLSEEAQLIEKARRTLAHDPQGALALLDEHQRRFAKGKLSMERALLRVDVLRRSGRTHEARQLAEALLARAQKGIYEPRLRQMLKELGTSPP